MNRKIRVRRKPPKRRRRGFAQAVVDYPASDWYIYAAVIDLRPPDSSPSSAAPSLPPQNGLPCEIRYEIDGLKKVSVLRWRLLLMMSTGSLDG
ncbi:hypothetical protein OPV22_005355 [Ensete ventricosum]|uniref:Amine oxidase n=1 Tax=Ensete ventricosum TaxID=4639 RepID=A0AAV8RQU8_ENSVE|nr:hypothetical protein OPV22_005355 [Ensete ventricosum]